VTDLSVASCTGKIAYVSPQVAWRAAAGRNNRYASTRQKTRSRPYKCGVCGLWHLAQHGRPW
jgi:hypothetical protein